MWVRFKPDAERFYMFCMILLKRNNGVFLAVAKHPQLPGMVRLYGGSSYNQDYSNMKDDGWHEWIPTTDLEAV